MTDESTITLSRLQQRIAQQWQITLSLPQISALLVKLDYRRIVREKSVIKQTRTNRSLYKIQQWISEAQGGAYHLLFGDEAWWSLIAEIGLLWAKKGRRPLIKVCCKCGFVYVVGFVEPMTRPWISYLVLALNSQWYSQLLVLLADMINGERIKLIVDGVSWHISGDVDLPDNITLEVLPPYSPELNLV